MDDSPELTEDQFRLAAATEHGPRRAELLDQVTVLADRRGAYHHAASDAALSARKMGVARRYQGKKLVYTWVQDSPRRPRPSPCTSSKSPPRIPHQAKKPRRTWSPPNV